MEDARLLSRAVSDGIISVDQERQLADLASTMAAESGNEVQERFRVIRDFNDVFISVGVVLVALAVQFLLPSVSEVFRGPDVALPTAWKSITWALVESVGAAALFWVLAELLVHRRRSALTGLVLLIVIWGFLSTPLIAVMQGFVQATIGQGRTEAEMPWLSGSFRGIEALGLISLLFFARFRLPVALGLFAASASLSLLFLIGGGSGEGLGFRITAVVIGLAVLAGGIALDVIDRERTTWRSDAAFWLHAVSAPYIVIGVVGPQVFSILFRGLFVVEVSDGQWAALIASLVALVLVAVVIDRRSLVLSSIAAWGVVLYSAFGSIDVAWSGSTALILLVLGVGILALGSFWQAVRRALYGLTSWLPVWAFLLPVRGSGPVNPR